MHSEIQALHAGLTKQVDVLAEHKNIKSVVLLVTGVSGNHEFMLDVSSGNVHERTNIARLYVKQQDNKMLKHE